MILDSVIYMRKERKDKKFVNLLKEWRGWKAAYYKGKAAQPKGEWESWENLWEYWSEP